MTSLMTFITTASLWLSVGFAPTRFEQPLNPSVVLVHAGNHICTGFIIGKDRVLTAGHCVPHALVCYFDTQVRYTDGHVTQGCILNWNVTKQCQGDWAIIKTDTGDRPIVATTLSLPTTGAPITHVGYPGRQGVQKVAYSHYLGIAQRHLFMIGGKSIGGESGSPVFNTKGEAFAIDVCTTLGVDYRSVVTPLFEVGND